MAKRPAFLLTDPAPGVLRTGWMIWFAWLIIGGTLTLHDAQGGRGGVGAVLVAPFWVLWLIWPLYRGLRALVRWRAGSIWADWQGQYFAFDDRQIRVHFDGDAVWFDAADVYDALGLHGHQRDPERVRQIAGRDGLQPAPGTQRLSFTESGLAAWLERRSDAQAVKFKRWVEVQVLAPHQRRREIYGPR